MTRGRVLLVVIGAVLLVAAASGQQRPNFSGRWVIVSPPDAAGEEQIVKQDATTLTTEHASEGSGHRAVYKLDGTESRNVLTVHDSDIVTSSKASWDGSRLTITSATSYADGRRVDQSQVWSLDADGRLIIEVTESTPGHARTTVKLVHTKR